MWGQGRTQPWVHPGFGHAVVWVGGKRSRVSAVLPEGPTECGYH